MLYTNISKYISGWFDIRGKFPDKHLHIPGVAKLTYPIFRNNFDLMTVVYSYKYYFQLKDTTNEASYNM